MGWDSAGYAVRKCPSCHSQMIRMGGNWSGECGYDTYRFDCEGCQTSWETDHGNYRCTGKLTSRGKVTRLN